MVQVLLHDKTAVAALLCCCVPCMLCCCAERVKRVVRQTKKNMHVANAEYVHVGTEILMNRDGMMLVNPCYYEARYFGVQKYDCCSGATMMADNHNLYDDCIRMWIHQIHPMVEESLDAKLLFQQHRETLGVQTV